MFDKFKEIIGGSDYDEDFDDIEEVEEEEEVEEVEPIISKQRGNKVVNIHNSASAKVMVVKPNSYDDRYAGYRSCCPFRRLLPPLCIGFHSVQSVPGG